MTERNFDRTSLWACSACLRAKGVDPIKMKTRSTAVRKKILRIKPIGIIRSPFKKLVGMPIQAAFSKKGHGTVELLPEFRQGLQDLEGFSHIMLIYQFHKSKGYRLLCRPFLDEVQRGVFATRAPARPNPIGISIVKVKKIRGNKIEVASLDVLDGTPLLDIKPYVPRFDAPDPQRVGWVEKALGKKKARLKADNRYADIKRK
jgi:tRNA-Thr(GGU) m(6)t(6)A37 methyltransferase TsaA